MDIFDVSILVFDTRLLRTRLEGGRRAERGTRRYKNESELRERLGVVTPKNHLSAPAHDHSVSSELRPASSCSRALG